MENFTVINFKWHKTPFFNIEIQYAFKSINLFDGVSGILLTFDLVFPLCLPPFHLIKVPFLWYEQYLFTIGPQW